MPSAFNNRQKKEDSMILNEDTLNQLINWMKRKGVSSFVAHRVVMTFYKTALEVLEEEEVLPLFNMEGFYFRKKKGEIELYSKDGNCNYLFL